MTAGYLLELEVNTITESDAKHKVTQPNRGPRIFGWLVDQYMASLSAYPPEP